MAFYDTNPTDDETCDAVNEMPAPQSRPTYDEAVDTSDVTPDRARILQARADHIAYVAEQRADRARLLHVRSDHTAYVAEQRTERARMLQVRADHIAEQRVERRVDRHRSEQQQIERRRLEILALLTGRTRDHALITRATTTTTPLQGCSATCATTQTPEPEPQRLRQLAPTAPLHSDAASTARIPHTPPERDYQLVSAFMLGGSIGIWEVSRVSWVSTSPLDCMCESHHVRTQCVRQCSPYPPCTSVLPHEPVACAALANPLNTRLLISVRTEAIPLEDMPLADMPFEDSPDRPLDDSHLDRILDDSPDMTLDDMPLDDDTWF